jgi:hypothetical protein
MNTDRKPSLNSAQSGNKSKPLLCDVTLKYLISNLEERLKILEESKETPITLGRINEMQCLIVHLQQFVLDNIT